MRRRRSAIRVAVIAIAVLGFFWCAPLAAQEINATITGRVADPQGAVLPGVIVTVLNVETAVASEAVTDAAGNYTVRQILPGRYRITAALPGFKSYTRDGVVLHTAEVATIHIRLELGAIEETVVVTAGLSEVETNQSTIAQAIENKRISELPLNGRQVYMLMQLTAGTLFTQTTFGATGFSGTRAWDVNGSLSVHGSRTGNNEFLIEGAPSSGTGGGTGNWNYAPPVDTIEEFKIQTASTDASYGRTSGGVVNMRLRSGTNELRGSGIMLYRGTALDANQIQNIRNRISNEGHAYYNGEAMTSGPIRRGRTFFMGGYQGFYENIPFPVTRTIPTEAQLRGDFSQTFTATGQLIVIYDPRTTRPNPAGTGFIRDPFPGNVIPEDRWHPIAKALLPHLPRPNATPSNISGTDNFVNSPNLGRYRYNSYLTRIDHVISDRHRLSFSNSSNWGIEYRNENGLPEPAIRSDNYPTHRNHYLVTVDDNITLNSTTVWNTRFSWDRFDEPHEKEYGNIDPTLPFLGPYQLTRPPFPQIGGLFSGGGQDVMFPRTFREPKNDAYTVSTSVSKSMGSHFAKIGGEIRAYEFFRHDEFTSNGRFNFTNDFTRRDPLSNAGPTSGSAFASFLLGLPNSGNVDTGVPRTERYRYYAIYLQDDWRLGPRATFNLGLRYDYQPPVTVKDGLTVTRFDTTTTNPLQSRVSTQINPATGQPLILNGGLVYANQGGPTSPYKSDWNNIQPRVGFTYKVNDRLLARGNYGRSYLGLSSGGQAGVYFTDFSRSTPFVAKAPNNVDPGTPWATPFPDGFLQPRAGELGLLTLAGQNLGNVPNPDYEIPYTDQWSAGVDVQLPWNIGLDVAYVGNKVSQLGVGRPINVVPKSERDRAIARLGGNPNYLNQTFRNPFAGLLPGTTRNGATLSRGDLLRPFPQFGTITMNRLNLGSAYYNALEAAATKRYSNGVMFAVNYTWMKLEDQTEFLTDYDTEPYRDLSGNQRRHRLVITTLVDLPFGPGKRIGGHVSGFVAHLIGGWQFNTIGEIQTGRPLAFSGNAILLADTVKLPKGQQTYNRWFDNSTRTNPRPDGTFTWDVIGANDYRQVGFRLHDVNEPTVPQWAFSLFKNTRMTNRVNLQVRVEMFNVFNARLYGGPQMNPSSANFGIVSTGSQVNFARTTQLGLRMSF
ncbi:MAG: TonB-dependent receptor [Acidobacteria bacterium]|nr:TonB-dependent receptor [Acidobacteriota bacterium]